MNWKNRLTNYNFWISIVSAVLLILQAFEFQFDIMYINEIATAVLGLLVVIGIINDPTKTSVKKEKKQDENVVSENNVVKNVESVEEKTSEAEKTNLTETEESTFPVCEQAEAVDESVENDIKNFVEEITADNEVDFNSIVKNILTLLKLNNKSNPINEESSIIAETENSVEEEIQEQDDVQNEIIREQTEPINVENEQNELNGNENQEVQCVSFNIVN